MPILNLIAALVVQGQSAPADVPKDHWAFPAVDALFREGLLKGYPSGKQPVLVLDKNAKKDRKKLKAWMSDWKVRGLLVGYPDDPYHIPPDNTYFWAVAVHAMWSNLTWDSDTNRRRTDPMPDSLSCFPRLAEAISMLEPELTKLGADVPQMIADLNRLRTGAQLESLKLDKTLKPDLKQAKVWLTEWKVKGILVGYPDRHEPSNYEVAVAIHATLANIEEQLKKGSLPEDYLLDIRTEMPNVARAISMFHKELTQFGADPEQMIAKLTDLRDSRSRLFHGDRL